MDHLLKSFHPVIVNGIFKNLQIITIYFIFEKVKFKNYFMELIEVTKKQLEHFYLNGVNWISNIHKGVDNKFSYAVKKMIKRVKDDYEDYQDKITELRYDYVSLDKDGNLQYAPNGQYSFKPEKIKEFNKIVKRIGEDKVSVEPFIAKFIPDDFPYNLREVFTPFVIPYDEDIEPDDEKQEN